MDVRENTTGGDGNGAQKLGEFLIVADGQLDVARDDAGLLVVSGRVASEFENFGGEVLEDRGEVHRSTGTNAGGVLARLQVARNTANRELKSRLGGSAHGLLAGLTLSSSRHCVCSFSVVSDCDDGSACLAQHQRVAREACEANFVSFFILNTYMFHCFNNNFGIMSCSEPINFSLFFIVSVYNSIFTPYQQCGMYF